MAKPNVMVLLPLVSAVVCLAFLRGDCDTPDHSLPDASVFRGAPSRASSCDGEPSRTVLCKQKHVALQRAVVTYLHILLGGSKGVEKGLEEGVGHLSLETSRPSLVWVPAGQKSFLQGFGPGGGKAPLQFYI